MKDHSSGCTFGGCASYSMALQGHWSSNLFGAGLGLYTSNEWPSGSGYSDVGSLSDLKNKIVNYIVKSRTFHTTLRCTSSYVGTI